MQTIVPTHRHIRIIAWAFFWRWVLALTSVTLLLHFLKPKMNFEISTLDEFMIYTIANFLAIYQILGNFLNTKRFKKFRIVLTPIAGPKE